MIKNLNQLKKALEPGVEFEIVLHCRPKCIGQIRKVTRANTAGVYTLTGEGKELWFEWGPARCWTFDAEGICAQYSEYKDRPNEILFAFKIIN